MRVSRLLLTCALALSAVAAYYSIVGLATIFSSAFFAVIVMACMLEISKLVVTSYLYHHWRVITGPIRVYLTSAVVILMLITSLGIFGFLSRAHVEQGLHNSEVSMRIEQVDARIRASNDVIARYQEQLDQLNRSVNLQLDANRAPQALAARQRQTAERDQIRQRLDAEQVRMSELHQQRLTLVQQLRILESEVGPIRYVAEFFVAKGSVDLEKAVRWMILVIVLVFDPLAILMLIAANMSLAHETRSKDLPKPSMEQLQIQKQTETLDALRVCMDRMSVSVHQLFEQARTDQKQTMDQFSTVLLERLTTSAAVQHANEDKIDQEDKRDLFHAEHAPVPVQIHVTESQQVTQGPGHVDQETQVPNTSETKASGPASKTSWLST